MLKILGYYFVKPFPTYDDPNPSYYVSLKGIPKSVKIHGYLKEHGFDAKVKVGGYSLKVPGGDWFIGKGNRLCITFNAEDEHMVIMHFGSDWL